MERTLVDESLDPNVGHNLGLDQKSHSDEFRAVSREAGVPVIRLHDVRHSVATLLHSAGTAPAHAAALLGHGLPVHVATYVTATQEGVDAAGAALGRVFAEAK